MGLAGRKQKQRIPADPRNLSWADDASRFGLSYLSKFGWDASKGLGSSGDGMKTHLKVQQKLDMMGVGAQHERDPNGVAWKQNKDFEALLERLNAGAVDKKGDDGDDAEERGREERERVTGDGGEEEKDSPVTTKKRKCKDADDSDAKKKKKRKKQKEKSDSDIPAIPDTPTPEDQFVLNSVPNAISDPAPKPRPMAHRARIRAAKRIAGKSASAISEILGIAPPSSTPTPTPPPPSTPITQHPVSHDNLTTSTKSLADYFKEKLLSRASSSSSPASSSSVPSGSVTPSHGTTGLGFSSSDVSIPDDGRPGIGSRPHTTPLPTQVPDSGPAFGEDDCNTDRRDVLTEKQRQKAGRKAKKRKQREADSTSVCPKAWVV